eukprot:m51a1_g12278 putative zinc finger hit domain-containing protein 1 homolog (296) ;mRNA; r:232644-233673
MSSNKYVCACGQTFETSQLKASHCRNCLTYQADKGGSTPSSQYRRSHKRSAPDGGSHATSPAVSPAPSPSVTPSAPATPAPPPVVQVERSPAPAATPRPMVAMTGHSPRPQRAAAVVAAAAVQQQQPASALSQAAMHRDATHNVLRRPDLIGLIRHRVLERLDQDNYKDPTGAVRRGVDTSGIEDDNFSDAADDAGDDDTSRARKRKRKSTRNRTSLVVSRSFVRMLEDSGLDQLPAHVPSYLTAAAGPSRFPRRHFCSVCGAKGTYACVLCHGRFCSCKCNTVHRETRCQKSVI